ncbi:tail completion protein [Streptomyces phage phiScoe54]|nr:tail completion protein [Streptomyces phage phiScoe54]
MFEIDNKVEGKDFEKFIAMMPGVAGALDDTTFEVAVKAEALLKEHQDYDEEERLGGHSEIDIERGRVDRYVVLNDDRGQKAAMSIEYGRAAGKKTVKDKHGNDVEIEWGASEGLFILAQASNLPKKRKGKVRLK